MISEFKPAILITVVFTVLTGIIYPLAVTGLAQMAFPHRANGSLVTVAGKVVGSELIAQGFAKPEYFHPRPSSAGTNGYDATSSSASNLGPTNPDLEKRLKKDAAAWHAENPEYRGMIPSDAITSSGSGLDPEISLENARAQVARVGGLRTGGAAAVAGIVESVARQREFGVLGESRVNVLKLNLALDAQAPILKK